MQSIQHVSRGSVVRASSAISPLLKYHRSCRKPSVWPIVAGQQFRKRHLAVVNSATQAEPTAVQPSSRTIAEADNGAQHQPTGSVGAFGAALRWIATPTLFLLLGAHMLNPQGKALASALCLVLLIPTMIVKKLLRIGSWPSLAISASTLGVAWEVAKYRLPVSQLATVSLLYTMQVPRVLHSWVTHPVLLTVLEGTYSKLLSASLLAGGVVLFVALMALDGIFGVRKETHHPDLQGTAAAGPALDAEPDSANEVSTFTLVNFPEEGATLQAEPRKAADRTVAEAAGRAVYEKNPALLSWIAAIMGQLADTKAEDQEAPSMTASSQEWVARQGRLLTAATAKAVANAQLLETSLKGLQDSLLAEQFSLVEKFPDALADAKAVEGSSRIPDVHFRRSAEGPANDQSAAHLQTVLEKLSNLEEATKEEQQDRRLQYDSLLQALVLPESIVAAGRKQAGDVSSSLSSIDGQLKSLVSRQSSGAESLQTIGASLDKVSSQVDVLQALLGDSKPTKGDSEASETLLAQLKLQMAEMNASMTQLAAAASKLTVRGESQGAITGDEVHWEIFGGHSEASSIDSTATSKQKNQSTNPASTAVAERPAAPQHDELQIYPIEDEAGQEEVPIELTGGEKSSSEASPKADSLPVTAPTAKVSASEPADVFDVPIAGIGGTATKPEPEIENNILVIPVEEDSSAAENGTAAVEISAPKPIGRKRKGKKLKN